MDSLKLIFKREETVPVPRDAAWGLFSDWSNASEWMPEVDSAQVEGETRAGATLKLRARGKDIESHVVEWIPNQRAVLESRQGKMLARYEYRFDEASADRTRITLTASGRASGWLRVLQGVIFGAIEKTDGVSLERFRAFAQKRHSS